MISRVAFRVDASSRIGTGHVMRCLTLANALRSQGVETHFICRAHVGHLGSLIQRSGHFLTLLPACSQRPEKSDDALKETSEGLGAPWKKDAEETAQALQGEKTEWLIVDHYAIDDKWEMRVRTDSIRIMVVGGLPNRRHDCDLLHDQNFYIEHNSVWRPLVSEGCELLLGPKYALLRPEFRKVRVARRGPSEEISRIAISFGGVDPVNVTGFALEAVLEAFGREIFIEVIVGPNNPNLENIASRAKGLRNVAIHHIPIDIAKILAMCDVAIGGAGVSMLERMCLGVPSVVISLAPNQALAVRDLARRGLCFYLGDFKETPAAELVAQLHMFAKKPDSIRKAAIMGARMVDGKGVDRVCEKLLFHNGGT